MVGIFGCKISKFSWWSSGQTIHFRGRGPGSIPGVPYVEEIVRFLQDLAPENSASAAAEANPFLAAGITCFTRLLWEELPGVSARNSRLRNLSSSLSIVYHLFVLSDYRPAGVTFPG